MRKKRLLIIIGSFNVGGTIVSLKSLLSHLDPHRMEVDVFARQKMGDFADQLPNCHILDENIWLSHTIYHKSNIVRYLNLFLLCIRKTLGLIGIDLSRLYNYIGGKQIHTEEYDAVVAYDETLPRYVVYMPAKKRISWIHCDYRRYANGKDESRYYDKIDTIVCVADSMRKVFVDIYPQYSDKTFSIHNLINIEDIIERSKESIDDNLFTQNLTSESKAYTIVSCGRLDAVKQFSLIPDIAFKLKAITDNNFKWFIIGEGEDRNAIESAIQKYNMQDVVIMLGKKVNPYPYIAKADAYVCTSYSEAHPLVVNEARALCVPVICNSFESAYESVIDGVDGYIVANDTMHIKLAEMMDKPLEIKHCQIDNKEALDKIYSLLDTNE